MTDFVLAKLRLRGGVWEGSLSGPADATPVLALRHNGDIVAGLTVSDEKPGTWRVRAPVPADRISDDLQTFVITDEGTDTVLASFVIFAGEELDDDLRAEVDLLRAELDLLKRAFRRHCIDTA